MQGKKVRIWDDLQSLYPTVCRWDQPELARKVQRTHVSTATQGRRFCHVQAHAATPQRSGGTSNMRVKFWHVARGILHCAKRRSRPSSTMNAQSWMAEASFKIPTDQDNCEWCRVIIDVEAIMRPINMRRFYNPIYCITLLMLTRPWYGEMHPI